MRVAVCALQCVAVFSSVGVAEPPHITDVIESLSSSWKLVLRFGVQRLRFKVWTSGFEI